MAAIASIDAVESMARRAASFWDEASHVASGEPFLRGSEREGDERLNEWARVVGSESTLRRRLDFDQLTVAQARLRVTMPASPARPPRWVGAVEDAAKARHRVGALLDDGELHAEFPLLNSSAPVAFEELLLPFIAVARERAAGASGGRYGRLAATARAGVERALLQTLSELCGRALLVEFRTWLACRQLSPVCDGASGTEQDPSRAYREFVVAVLSNGWVALFKDYPVLSRLLGTAVINWTAATTELLLRLEHDLAEIRTHFAFGSDPLTPVEIRSGLSDPHRGGRTVACLTFASGEQIIYKPKPLAIEVAWGRLVDWLANDGATTRLRYPKALDRGDYGWAEYIEPRALASDGEARRFYQRLGAFLCLVYLLNGIDFHFENLVACGDDPVAVDLETLFHPATAPDRAGDDDPVSRQLRASVLRADILPNPVKLHDRYYDLSALGDGDAAPAIVEMLRWTKVNTDRMSLSRGPMPRPEAGNLPTLDGRRLNPGIYARDISDGFRDMYRHLCRRREALLGIDSPLRQLYRCQGRFLFRATAFYQSVLNRLLRPDCLRHGIDFSIQLDVLSRRLAKAPVKPAAWPLVAEEARALLNGDIPKFLARGDDTSLTLNSGKTLPAFFAQSAWDDLAEKFQRFDEEDLTFQIQVIGAAMDAESMHAQPPPADGARPSPNFTPRRPFAALSHDELLHHATSIGRRVAEAALHGDGGEPGWLVLNFVPEARRFALQPIGLDLYNGRCGIALFFAALERCAADGGFGQLSLRTLAPVRRWLRSAGPREVEGLGLGGLTGLPSLVYSLTRAAAWLEDPELMVEAGRAAALIEPAQIESDLRLDIMGGTAGAILCLLALHDATGASEPLDKAVLCGRRILALRTPAPCGARTWTGTAGVQLTGFAHGAAGIAYALLRLGEKTAVPEFCAAAGEAIAFEAAEFNAEAGNWPDRRPQGAGVTRGQSFKLAWCSGAPGIGLARAGGLPILDSPEIRRDLDSALATTASSPLLDRDHLCCGNIGLTDTLLKAGEALDDPLWRTRALGLAATVAERASREGGFRIKSQTGFFNPCLFQGAAGVGYQLLRLAFPDKIASILLLE